ncbi:Protein-L-isoaspartate O-methyltransferase [Phycisphaerae bacterium RAS1]|nr:Protein-L-isoaspartate O-methyltransferase [Phycisphaerae bacterium RAS1]
MIVRQLVARGVNCARVIDAIRDTPRELFVAADQQDAAYDDAALPIDCGQTISQPYIVAYMTELLEPAADARALEIGTGSGYQAAVLARLVRQVYSIERHERLMAAAARRLAQLELQNVALRCGDGSLGWPEEAPFDAILVTAGAPEIPVALESQLCIGGRLVAPVGPLDDQMLVRVRRTARGFVRERLLRCRFVRLIGVQGWSPDT